MAAVKQHKYIVFTAKGQDVEVTATRVVVSDDGYTVDFFDGDAPVGSFRSFGSFHRV